MKKIMKRMTMIAVLLLLLGVSSSPLLIIAEAESLTFNGQSSIRVYTRLPDLSGFGLDVNIADLYADSEFSYYPVELLYFRIYTSPGRAELMPIAGITFGAFMPHTMTQSELWADDFEL